MVSTSTTCCLEWLRQGSWLWRVPALLLALFLSACGGGASSNSISVISGPVIQGNNVMPVTVSSGLGGYSGVANRLYASVTVCTPGSSSRCVTIDTVLVDTGSVGLRLMSSSALTGLGLLPPGGFSALQNCVRFLDNSSAWGNVKVADVKLGNMVAPGIPVQIINDPAITATSPCPGSAMLTAAASSATDNHALRANGILGVGTHTEDCGTNCAIGTNGTYYTCTGSTCVDTVVSTSAQVQNPIPHFASDNNGLAVVLPPVGNGGTQVVNGSILFGVGTQTNNQLGTSALLQTSGSMIGTSITSVTPPSGATISNLGNMPGSFLDTGSNGLYFGTTAMPICGFSVYFYCPTSGPGLTFSATLSGSNGVSKTVSFLAANAGDQFNSPNFALPALTGGAGNNSAFDWGLPFYYGRTVFLGINGMSASTGANSPPAIGPFYAF